MEILCPYSKKGNKNAASQEKTRVSMKKNYGDEELLLSL